VVGAVAGAEPEHEIAVRAATLNTTVISNLEYILIIVPLPSVIPGAFF
jgi:hypothetical protein